MKRFTSFKRLAIILSGFLLEKSGGCGWCGAASLPVCSPRQSNAPNHMCFMTSAVPPFKLPINSMKIR